MFPSTTSWNIRSLSETPNLPILNSEPGKYLCGFSAKSKRAAFLSLPSSVMRFRLSRMVSVESERALDGIRDARIAWLRK